MGHLSSITVLVGAARSGTCTLIVTNSALVDEDDAGARHSGQRHSGCVSRYPSALIEQHRRGKPCRDRVEGRRSDAVVGSDANDLDFGYSLRL